MKKVLLFICVISLCSFTSTPADKSAHESTGKDFPSLLSDASATEPANHLVDSIYNKLNLDSAGLRRNVFFYAYKGYQYLLSKGMLSKTDLLTICDYSQSSHNKRLYVINVAEGKLLFNTYVSHGKNSGGEYATSFSNKINSDKSSLGFLITADTYKGRSGYSMHFDGVEPDFNNNVRRRSIVMHGSWYVNAQRADEGTMMGRSFGCPAVPYAEHEKIIDAIKGGSCFFAYVDDSWYLHSSKILNAEFSWPSLINSNEQEEPTTLSKPQ